MKPLHKQEIDHFGDLHPTSKAESQIIRTVHLETKSQVLSLKLKERPHCVEQCRKGSQIFYELSLCLHMKKIIFLRFCDLNLPK